MNTKKQIRRRLGISIFIIILSAGSYTRIPGTENVRLIIVLTLITIGIGIGIFLTNLFAYIKADDSADKKEQ